MMLCIPVRKREGLESPLSDHFGRAPCHLIVETRTLRCEIISKEGRANNPLDNCLPIDLLVSRGVTAVICKGIGRGALENLRANNIAVYSTCAKIVQEVIEAFILQQLPGLDESLVCNGHHHKPELSKE